MLPSSLDSAIKLLKLCIPRSFSSKKPLTPSITDGLLTIENLINKLENEDKTSFLGQIKINEFKNNYFSLNINQRVLLNVMENEKIIALNGPPGTGKTTALQSVIATKIVSSFLKEKKMPIFFGASSTNQAKDNIIEGFKYSEIHSEKESNILFKRWIKLNDNELNYGIPLNGNGIVLDDYNEFINIEYIYKCKDKYIQHSKKLNTGSLFNSNLNFILDLYILEDNIINKYLNNNKKNIFDKFHNNIEKLSNIENLYEIKKNLLIIGKKIQELLEKIEFNKRNIIKDLRKEKYDKFKSIIKKFKKNINPFPKNLEIIFNEHAKLENNETINIDLIYRELSYIIDNFFKPVLFHLSMRYYEAIFLENLEKIIKEKKIINDKSFKQNYKDKKYEVFSNISPVFVSTMDGLPNSMYKPVIKNINKNKMDKPIFEKNDSYLFNFIDYLIVDEAGQCNSEKGAINLAFAKKAIIVGDTDQIEPVFSISDIEDYNAINHSFKENIEYDDFIIQPYNSHKGNLMKMAQNASNYSPYFNKKDNLSKGLYLLEHRRCPREVIEYCNEVVYGKKLIYPGGDEFINLKNNSALYLKEQKPWGFINVEGEAEKIGTSNVNKLEAKKILEWIDENYIELTLKGKKLKDVIAILTCFSGQEKIIRNEIYKMNFKNINKKDFEGVTIGTAHKLQGAEKPIILFSFVYDTNSIGKLNFIDKNKNIINVAVSRAKQSFYVFGNKEVLSKAGNETPTAFLWKYINKYIDYK